MLLDSLVLEVAKKKYYDIPFGNIIRNKFYFAKIS